MTDKPNKRRISSSRRRSAKKRTDWDLVGLAAAISVVLVGIMGYVALCPWSPFEKEHDAQAVAERLQRVGSVTIGEAGAQ